MQFTAAEHSNHDHSLPDFPAIRVLLKSQHSDEGGRDTGLFFMSLQASSISHDQQVWLLQTQTFSQGKSSVERWQEIPHFSTEVPPVRFQIKDQEQFV